MMQIPMDVFAYTKEAVAAARGGRLIFANAAAKEILGEDCQGRAVKALMGVEVAEAQASNFVADVCSAGRSFALRATKQENLQFFFLSQHEKQPELLNDAFIYSLRNSIMTLNLALDMCRLRAEELNDAQILENMREISRSQMRLSRLLSNVTVLRDRQNGGECFAPVNFDLAGMCRAMIDCVAALTENVEFTLNAPQSLFVNADASQLKKLVSNLISNCLVHGSGLSRVSVNLVETADFAMISVSDDGCGIEGDKLHRVFDRYRHIYGMDEMNGGAGLGLSLVRVIAQRHGGTLLLESRNGHGTTVKVSIRKDKNGGVSLRSGTEEQFEVKTALMELSDCLDSRYYGEKYMD